jgi:ribonucleoside-diphosphate reductase alpha chain
VNKMGLQVNRVYTKIGVNPFDQFAWEIRDSKIEGSSGEAFFAMSGVEVPSQWSQRATDIVASKYFRKAGVPGTGGETSVKQLVTRVVRTIAEAGVDYFASEGDVDAFADELTYMLCAQIGAFNSPVWFNVGLFHDYGITGAGQAFRHHDGVTERVDNVYEFPQASACFIQSVDDSLSGIMDLVKNETMLFKYGSGTGTNFSNIRGKSEKLAGGGVSSGLMSFLEVFDRAAGAIKSGGTVRRAAKMVCLDMDHPEIVEFITWKMREEKKAHALIAAGYPSDFNGEAYATVGGQNSNNSVRVSDEFMKRAKENCQWHLIARTTAEKTKSHMARDLWRTVAEAAHACADPGVQYDDTINAWHTCPNSGRINASNPCSEFMFLDDTACNLASLNLTKFLGADNAFDIPSFRHAVRIFFIAQDILVGLSSYPTADIAKNSHDFRPLGLGYANLGTLLMLLGKPYDSDEGRSIAASITSLMTAHAALTSAEMAKIKGSFAGFAVNKNPMLDVMSKHLTYADATYRAATAWDAPIASEAIADWQDAILTGQIHGFRNAQFSVLAPTGTIGLLMDCDTTGIEPDFALVKVKKLAGGGTMKIVNMAVTLALTNLGYNPEQVDKIVKEFAEGTLPKNSHWLLPEHRNVFACANEIDAMGHVKMMAAVQPFLSGAISKTVNLPNSATVDDVQKIYEAGHKLGLKSIALYRDGCKASQPLNAKPAPMLTVPVTNDDDVQAGARGMSMQEAVEKYGAAHGVFVRRKLPARRTGFTQETKVGGHKMFIRTGEYPDGKLGEIFVDMHKEGATLRSLVNCFAIAVSTGLQHGVPLEAFVDKFTFTRFEPQGVVEGDDHVKFSTSIVDYIFRMLGVHYLGQTDLGHVVPTASVAMSGQTMGTDAPPCDQCGYITVRNAACYRCLNCGHSMGCS